MGAFIFDVDGTLAETERYGHRVAFNRAFADAGLNWYWSESLYGKLLSISGGKERLHHFLTHYVSNSESIANQEQLVKQLHAAKRHHYHQILHNGEIGLRPGVKRFIKEAHQTGMRLAIATTSSLESVNLLLATNLGEAYQSYFEIIAAGDIVPQKKPAPDIYQYVLNKMALSPQDALAFEDSQQGLKAATMAKIKTVITVNNYTLDQDFSDAILVLNHFGEPDRIFDSVSLRLNRAFTIYNAAFPIHQSYFDLTLAKQLLQH